MIKTLITEFPITDVPIERSISKEKINKYAYTKEEVDAEVARLTALKYQLKRQGQDYSDPDVDLTDGVYPDLEDQLDLLYHDIENGTLTTSGNFYKTLKAVKDKFPKS